jgi:hypothetical protein
MLTILNHTHLDLFLELPWNEFSKDKFVAKFIEDINDFQNMVNRVHNNF